MKFTVKKHFFYAQKGIDRFIITNKKICFIGWNYTKEETVEFLKEKGHYAVSQIQMIKMIRKANHEIKLEEKQAYKEWLEYIDDQREQGYSVAGDFFGGYEDYYRIVGKEGG